MWTDGCVSITVNCPEEPSEQPLSLQIEVQQRGDARAM